MQDPRIEKLQRAIRRYVEALNLASVRALPGHFEVARLLELELGLSDLRSEEFEHAQNCRRYLDLADAVVGGFERELKLATVLASLGLSTRVEDLLDEDIEAAAVRRFN